MGVTSTISGKQGSAAAGLSVVLRGPANREARRDVVMELWDATDGVSRAWHTGKLLKGD